MGYPPQGINISTSAVTTITGGPVNIQTINDRLGEFMDTSRSTDYSVSTTTDGTEQTIYERTDGQNPIVLEHWNANLANLAAGDTLRFRVYIKNVSGGAYTKVSHDAAMTYTGDQTNPETIEFNTRYMSQYAIKVTMELTAGTNRAVQCEFFESLRAN